MPSTDGETATEADTMGRAKDEALEMIKRLPDDVTFEDMIEALYFMQQVEVGLRDVEEGRILTHEEVEERLAKWQKSVGH
jgi:predicted transcriptional regulator